MTALVGHPGAMPRTARKAPGGIVFHCINRGVGRSRLFHEPQDYAAFERVMAHALEAVPVRLLGYCLMPNRWHLLLWPVEKGQLGQFMHRLTMTHARRYQEHYHGAE
jgi:putative transposase